MNIRLLLLLVFALCSAPAAADQYSCQTVAQSAVAYVISNVPVSKFESGRRCSISVDGAIGTGGRSAAYVGAINNLNYELFESDRPPQIGSDMLVDMLAGPFGPDGDGRDSFPLKDELAAVLDEEDTAVIASCLTEFAQMLGPQFAYGELYDFGERRSDHARCTVMLPQGGSELEPGMTFSRDGVLAIEVKAGDLVFAAFLPASFLIDARDGNGTFN